MINCFLVVLHAHALPSGLLERVLQHAIRLLSSHAGLVQAASVELVDDAAAAAWEHPYGFLIHFHPLVLHLKHHSSSLEVLHLEQVSLRFLQVGQVLLLLLLKTITGQAKNGHLNCSYCSRAGCHPATGLP
jgi:hypothetical protein